MSRTSRSAAVRRLATHGSGGMMESIRQTPLSTFAFCDLAMRSAVELEKARENSPFEADPLLKLADALTHTTRTPDRGARYKFVEPGLYEPLERLFQADGSGASDVDALEQFMAERVKQLRTVERKKPSAKLAADLVSFCVALHRELIRDMTSEDELVVRDWRYAHAPVASGLG
jgi:hypothetical protein